MGIATSLMSALAAGAVWCLLAIRFHTDLMAAAFGVAALSAWILRAHGYARRWLGALAAMACVMVATVYAFSLRAVLDVSGLFGLPIGEAMRTMGPAMALDVALARLHGWRFAALVLATACAGALTLAWRPTAAGRVRQPPAVPRG